MRDEELRELRRLAKRGDSSAALLYYKELRRHGAALQPLIEIPSDTLSVRGQRMRGILNIRPLSATEVRLDSPESYVGGRRIYQPISIFGRDYNIVTARYYFYPETGWVPYDEETMEHAQEHLRRTLEWAAENKVDATNHENAKLIFWLPRPWQIGGQCFSCGDVRSKWIGSRLSIPGGSQTAYRNLGSFLDRAIPGWVGSHQETMRQAQLNFLQEEKKSIIKRLDELYQDLESAEKRISDLIIEEVNLEDD